ncbi:MAG: hypothetical protein HRU51_03430 [Xanthomonadales bacterium]|nr:hypothetical protein [Xanthomonadales bacterium]
MRHLPVEIDLWSTWYAAFSTWDSTINFWITATFAVLVASHSLRNSMTTQLSRYLAGLYVAFCLYTLLRAGSIYVEAYKLSWVMMEYGIGFSRASSLMNFLSNLTMLLIFIVASFVTVRFVLATAPDRQSGSD